jgi:hypothetical protein
MMKRLEEEIEEELKKSGQWGEMHEAAEEYLEWLTISGTKNPVNGLSQITKSFTGAPGLAILMGSALAHPIMQETFNGLFEIMSGGMDDISYALEDLSAYSLEDDIFGLIKRPGVGESLWLSMFPLRPVITKLSPEFFVSMLGLMGNKSLKINMLPVILSIAAPLVQELFTENIFAHLGDLEAYIEDGLYRYAGKEEE